MATETRHVWVLVTRSDISGQWLSHCLDLDIMSQGSSIEHALESLREAMLVCIADDDEHGLNPFDRGAAPDECWVPFWGVMKEHIPLDSVPESQRSQISAVVAKLRVTRQEAREDDDVLLEPPAWQFAAINRFREQNPESSRPC